MSPSHRLAAYLLITYAAAWPLQVYQFLPFTGMYLTTVLGFLLTGLWIWDAARSRQMRWPFELAWPLFLMVVILWTAAWREGDTLPVRLTAQVIFFGAVLHFARNREIITRCVIWSVWGCGAAAAAALLAWREITPPTAYSTVAPLTLAPAHDLMGGVLVLMLGVTLAGVPRGALVNPLPLRAAAAVVQAFALIVLAYLAYGAIRHGAVWSAPPFASLGWADWAVILLAAWFTARIAAKLWVDREVAYTRMHAFLIVVGLLMLFWFTLFDTPIRGAHVYLLGLAAGFAAYRRGPAVATPGCAWIGMCLLVLAAVNAYWVDAGNIHDPRRYNDEAAADLKRGDYAALQARLGHVERFAPGDGRSSYWRGKAFLEKGDALAAAVQFEQTFDPPPGQRFLRPPPGDERAEFMVQLRDLCSSLEEEERQWAYERVLAAQGEAEQAAAALAARTVPSGAEPSPGRHVREIAAFLLHGPEAGPALEAALDDVDADKLSALLTAWGAQWTSVDLMGEQISLAARRTARRIEIAVFSAGEPVTARLLLTAPAPSLTEPIQVALRWAPAEDGEAVNLIAEGAGEADETIARVRLDGAGEPRIALTGAAIDGRLLSHSAAVLAAR